MLDRSSLDALLPYQSKYLSIDGQRLHYLDEGSGPVVLLLHGNPTWCFYYRNLIGELRPHMRVIAPDYIGCGLSDHPKDRHYRAKDRIDHLELLLDHLGIKNFSLLMHDWGGPIGTGLAIRRIERVERLVYLNTTLTETECLPLIIKKAASPLIGRFLTKYTNHFVRLTTDFGVRKTLSPEVRAGYHFPYQTAERRTAIWDFVDDIPFDSDHPSYASMMEIARGLPEVAKKPVQIIWGLKDPCFHREMLSRVAAHFPAARVLEIPDASHLVLEDAFEQVSRVASAFLRGEGGRDIADATAENHTPNRPPNALYAGFMEQVATQPQADAAIVPSFWGGQVRYEHISFKELSLLIHKYQRGLTELGVIPGDKVLMLVPAGIEFLALSYAVIGRGAIPIFIDPGIGRENLFKCIADAAPTVMIGSAKAQLLRWLNKAALKSVRLNILAADPFVGPGPNLGYLKKFSAAPMSPVPAGDVGFIAFTSGATGIPKGVIFSDEMLADQRRIFLGPLGLKPGAKDLPLLPIFSLFNLSVGVTSVFFPIDSSKPLTLEPDRVTKVISDLRINYSFGSPTLWRKISEYCFRRRTDLPTIEKVFMAGAPVPVPTLERVQGVIPNGAAYTPYGATEALPVTLVGSSEIFGRSPLAASSGEEGTYVGAPIPGVDIRVIKSVPGAIDSMAHATILPPREIGEVVVRGRNVSRTYLNRPIETSNGKIPEGDSFWHRMGDMGYLDEAGHLYFCGRKAHVVGAQERTYFSIPTEAIFNRSERVRRSALVDLGQGRVGIVVEPEPHHWPESVGARANFLEELRSLAAGSPLTKHIEAFFFHPSFPVDARHNAKIYRDQLGVWAREQEALLSVSGKAANG
ncbi:MAG: hypothetical protein RL417_1611 [Pseudomonadota bacterium]